MARGPAPVLVTVGIEFCGSVSQSSIGTYIVSRGADFGRVASNSSNVGLCQRNMRGSSGILEDRVGGKYHSISGGPDQGSGLDNGLAIQVAALMELPRLTLARTSHCCGKR
jgi:hypothetical protein